MPRRPFRLFGGDKRAGAIGVAIFPEILLEVREQQRIAGDFLLALQVGNYGAVGQLFDAVAVAGVLSGGVPLWEIGDAQWNVQFDVNVHGVRNLATAAVPVLLDAPAPRQGRVVAVSSAAGLLGLPRLSGYSASKHAVIGLIKSLAADLAGTGITANAVCPGSTRTPILDASAAVYGLDSPEEFAHQQLVERLLLPAEPAALIAWLCGAEASGVTGAALSVDGGLTTS